MVIKVWENGQFVGYIKSISESRGRCSITPDISNAKNSYRSQDAIMHDIDVCAKIYFNTGKVFTIG